jgi:hypothetical protein
MQKMKIEQGIVEIAQLYYSCETPKKYLPDNVF